MKQGGHAPTAFSTTAANALAATPAALALSGKQGVLVGYWENEDIFGNGVGGGASARGLNMDMDLEERLEKAQWGPRSVGQGGSLSAVHSLALQRDELWALSGTEVRISVQIPALAYPSLNSV